MSCLQRRLPNASTDFSHLATILENSCCSLSFGHAGMSDTFQQIETAAALCGNANEVSGRASGELDLVASKG